MQKPPIIIVVDTREQLPSARVSESAYEFKGYQTIRQKLDAGDYSVQGYEVDGISIERKTLDDYVGSIILNRERFLREMELARRYEFFAVVVECSMLDIVKNVYRSLAHPNAVVGATAALMLDYHIPVIFCCNRKVGEMFTLRLLTKFYERKVKAAAAWPVVDMGVMDEITRRTK
ncbi:ERCC4 domain-containing protein [Sulfuricurvum sp.]|uniref:ERCC4 domain-containing protein n=1 Tax=Sulfuricurvum sp. TaxID=2025608 RepID=UPI0035643D53